MSVQTRGRAPTWAILGSALLVVVFGTDNAKGQTPNLSVRTLYLCDADGQPAVPRAGERFWVFVDYFYDNPTCQDYIIRRAVDGRAIDAPPLNWGCGSSGRTEWFHFWGTWILDEPGRYKATVTLDAANAIAESNENDNVKTISLDVAPAPDHPEFWLEWPLAGQIGRDLGACTLFDEGRVGDLNTFLCEPWTYEGHSGTDIGLNHDFEQMDRGSATIFAVAAGVVIQADDGYEDRRTNCNHPDPSCGNSVTLDHGNGYQSVYCHMKKGSVAVSPGQRVSEGDALGLVGSSGCSSGPHLHFEVRHHGLPLDPFVGPCNSSPPVGLIRPNSRASSVNSDVRLSGQCSEPFSKKFYFKPSELLVTVVSRFSNLPDNAVIRWEWVQNGAVYASREVTVTDALCGAGWVWCYFRPNATGPGSVRIYLDGKLSWEQPYLGVSAGFDPPANEPPAKPGIVFRGPPVGGQAVWVDVATPSFDRNYDHVHYRFEWFVDGRFVNERTTSALSDALSAGLILDAKSILCRVTALDGLEESEPADISAGVADRCKSARLKAACKGKQNPKLRVTLRSKLPAGTPLHVQLDGGEVRAIETDQKGSATLTFGPLDAGPHSACLLECPGLCTAKTCG